MNELLLKYVEDHVKKGKTLEQIQQTLQAAGWDEPDIAACFQKVNAEMPQPQKVEVQKKHHWGIVTGMIGVLLAGFVLWQFLIPTNGVFVLEKPMEIKGGEATPLDVYMSYKRAFDAAGSFDDMLLVAQTYGSKEFNAYVEQSIAVYPDIAQIGIAAVAKRMTPPLENIGELRITINGNIATLTGETLDGDKKARITMVYENNAWKIANDLWEEQTI